MHGEVEIKTISNMFYKFKLTTNKSALYRIQIYDVALVFGKYSQIARPRLCGRDASGVR